MVKKVYNNRWLTISKDKDYYFYDENYDQVVIIPIINKNNLVMVNQFRKPLKKYCLEFPAGGVNKNESPSKAAIRELYEETGIKVKNVQKIFRQIKLSINPQRSKAYPYAFMAKIDNKYIEIYNGTGSTVDLTNYSVKLYANANTSPTNTHNFSSGSSIIQGNTYVLYHSSANATIQNATGESSSIANFNGNDALELLKNHVYSSI